MSIDLGSLREIIEFIAIPATFIGALIAASTGYGRLHQKVAQSLDAVKSHEDKIDKIEDQTRKNSESLARILGILEREKRSNRFDRFS